MPITKLQAIGIADKISTGDTGVVHDDDVEEFVTVSGVVTHETLLEEIEELFNRESTEDDTKVDEDIAWIFTAMEYERNRKKFIMKKKEEGMTLEEAKKEYDVGKARIVKDALNLPDEPEEFPVTYDHKENTEEE